MRLVAERLVALLTIGGLRQIVNRSVSSHKNSDHLRKKENRPKTFVGVSLTHCMNRQNFMDGAIFTGIALHEHESFIG